MEGNTSVVNMEARGAIDPRTRGERAERDNKLLRLTVKGKFGQVS